MKDIIYPVSTEGLNGKQESLNVSYMICEISSKLGSHLGLLAFVTLDSLNQNRVLPNEKTYLGKQRKILASLLYEKVQKKPVLLTYEAEGPDLNAFKKPKPCFVICLEGITYRLWEIKDKEMVKKLSKKLNDIEQLIVADGHHRLAAMSQYYKSCAVSQATPCFLAFIIEKSQTQLLGFNKLLTRVEMSTQCLLESMAHYFEVVKCGAFEGVDASHPAFYLERAWYSFSLKMNFKTSAHQEPPAGFVHSYLVEKILGINPLSLEDKISSISHGTPIRELEQWVNNKVYQAAIYVPPLSKTEVFHFVKSGCYFPQNTTCFFPKINHDLFLFLTQRQTMVLDFQKVENVA